VTGGSIQEKPLFDPSEGEESRLRFFPLGQCFLRVSVEAFIPLAGFSKRRNKLLPRDVCSPVTWRTKNLHWAFDGLAKLGCFRES